MERVSVVVSCDRCQEDTDLDAGSGIIVRFGTDMAEVDLCDECREELLEELSTVLSNGRKVPLRGRPAKSEKEKIPCPDCGSEYVAGAGMAVHRKFAHGVRKEGDEDGAGLVDYAEAAG